MDAKTRVDFISEYLLGLRKRGGNPNLEFKPYTGRDKFIFSDGYSTAIRDAKMLFAVLVSEHKLDEGLNDELVNALK